MINRDWGQDGDWRGRDRDDDWRDRRHGDDDR